MNIVLLGHREFASNLGVSLVAAQLPEHNLRLFLSGEHSAFHASCPDIQALETFEERLCDEVSRATTSILSFSDLEDLTGHEIMDLPEPNTPAGLELLRSAEPDLLLSIRYRRILHAKALTIPIRGVINWHSGLLPDYQGVMATFWAMLNGASKIGSTCHYIVDKGIDTGPIIEKSLLTCHYGGSYLRNVHALYVDGYQMMVNAVQAINASNPPPTTPQPAGSNYYHAPQQADIDRFRTAGNTLFSGNELENLLELLEQRTG